MKIWDGLILNDELDLLELRLMEIGDLVDHVVVVESALTFSGRRKGLHFMDCPQRFEAWKEKIVYISVDGEPGEMSCDNEYAQRRAVADGWETADFADFVMLSDVDEIPSRSAVQWLRESRPATAVAFRQDLFYHKVNWRYDLPWSGTIAMPRGFGRIDCQQLRDTRNMIPYVDSGGWHFSWLGDAAAVSHKLECVDVAEDAQLYKTVETESVTPPDPNDSEFIELCVSTEADIFKRKMCKRWVPVIPGVSHPTTIEAWLELHPQHAVEKAVA